MGIVNNRVNAGDYKDANIKIKGFGNKVVLIKYGFITKKIELNKKTVDHIELIDKSQTVFRALGLQTCQVAIYFKDGKKSLAVMDSEIYQRLNEILF